MKYALCLRGIHYIPENNVDYRVSVKNYYDFLINPLKENNTVEVFILTYNSEKLESLMLDYSPVSSYILDSNEIPNGSGSKRQAIFNVECEKLINDYEKKEGITYDLIIILRFDLFLLEKYTFWNINTDLINISFKHSSGNCDDNFFTISRKYLGIFKAGMQTIIDNNYIAHQINKTIPAELIHYSYIVTKEMWEQKKPYKYWLFTKHIAEEALLSKDSRDFYVSLLLNYKTMNK